MQVKVARSQAKLTSPKSRPVVPAPSSKPKRIHNWVFAAATLLSFLCASPLVADELTTGPIATKLDPFRHLAGHYCVDCHSGPEAEARIDIESLTSAPIGKYFSDWRRVQRAIAEGSMPPADAEQPPNAEFKTAKSSLDDALNFAIRKAASDPGPTAVRRITNAEYEYCIEDLTGVKLNLKKLLISDSVGGSGFTNSATGQFMTDATLERYLETAKVVADHAMIGTGPLYFYGDAGQNGP